MKDRWMFDLARFDEPGDPPADPPADPDDKLGDGGKKALEAERAAARAARKEAADARAELDRIKAEADARAKADEDAKKSEAEKAAERIEALEAAGKAATERALKSEVKSLSDDFADKGDAILFLTAEGKLDRFLRDDGDIDSDAIGEALKKLLEEKPHLKKADADSPRTPKPDGSLGSRGGGKEVDYSAADKDTVKAALAEYGIRSRS